MTVRSLALIVVMLMCETGAAQNATGLDRAAWLQGCWELKTANRNVEEIWTTAKGGRNAAHDCPQQIGYRLDGDTLLAWIRGTQNGKDRRIEFPYTRARCAGR